MLDGLLKAEMSYELVLFLLYFYQAFVMLRCRIRKSLGFPMAQMIYCIYIFCSVIILLDFQLPNIAMLPNNKKLISYSKCECLYFCVRDLLIA